MQQVEIDYLGSVDIIVDDLIGGGTYGELYLVYSLKYDTNFAMKKIHVKNFNANELEFLKKLDHTSIVDLYDYYKFGDYVYLLMEYCPKDLHTELKEQYTLSEDVLQRYIHDILVCIKVCHDAKISHNDIKPANFLIDKYGRIKVCDFGLSRMYSENETTNSYKGTFFFMSPEILRKSKYNPIKADIWALGVTFFNMATGTYPYIASNDVSMLKLMSYSTYPVGIVKNPYLRQIISKCLEPLPENRPTVDELLSSPYFSKYNERKDNYVIPHTVSLCTKRPIIRPKCASSKPALTRILKNPLRRCASLKDV